MTGSMLQQMFQTVFSLIRRVDWNRGRLVEVLTGGLFAYISLVPFYYLQPLEFSPSLPSFSLPKYLPFLLVCTIILIWLYDVWKFRRPFVRTAIDSFALTYLSIGLLSLIQAAYPVVGLAKWAYYTTTGMLLCYLLFQYLTDWLSIWRLIRWVCIICGITALYTLFSHFLGQDYLWGSAQRRFNPYYDGNWRATGPFGNAVHLGAYLALCLPFMSWVCVCVSGMRQRLFYGMLAIATTAALAISQSRGGWVAAGIAIGIIFVVFIRRIWRRLRRDQKVVVLVVAVAAFPVVSGILQSMGMIRLFERQIIDMAFRVELTSQLRVIIYGERFRIAQYRSTFNVLEKHPLLGIGFGNFTRVYNTYKDPTTPSGYVARTTENMYLMFAAETGWLGLAAAFALLGSIFHTTYRAYRRSRGGKQRDLLLIFLASGAGFLINMGTWDALNEPTLRMTFWMLAGVALVAVRLENERGRQSAFSDISAGKGTVCLQKRAGELDVD